MLGVFLFHVKQKNLACLSENVYYLLFKEDNIRIWCNIEKLVVFKDQLNGVVFIGVNGIVYSEFRRLFEINSSHQKGMSLFPCDFPLVVEPFNIF